MCVENNQVSEQRARCIEYSKKSKTPTYSIKKALKALFKKSREESPCQVSTSLESLDNFRNTQVEDHYEEIEENAANEKLLTCIYDEVNQHPEAFEWNVDPATGETEIYVPVRFARTEAGTFFWTTNLQPVDVDLVQPAYCYSTAQHPDLQLQDRWAQA